LGKDVLEIGSGIGNFSKFLTKRHNLVATDINEDYLKILKKDFKKLNSGFGDLENNRFFFKNKKFDSIIAFNVLEHIKNDEVALKNAYKLLKMGGKFVVIVPAHELLFSEFDKNLGHFRRYTTRSFGEKAKRAGFKLEEVRYLNWISAIGWFMFVKVLKRYALPGREVGIFNTIGPLLLWPEKYIKFPFGLSVFAVLEK